MPDPELQPGVTTYVYPAGQEPDFTGQSISDEGGVVTPSAKDLNFVGTGVVAKDPGGDNNVDVEIPGAVTLLATIDNPIVKSYTLVGRATFPFTIEDGYFVVSSGGCGLSIQVNGTNVAGLTNVAVTTTPQVLAAVPTVVQVGDRVTVNVTGVALPTDLEISLGLNKIVE